MMNRPINFYFVISLALHGMLILLSGLVVTQATMRQPAPIRIHVLTAIEPLKNQDLPKGRVEDLPKPDKIEEPVKSDVLAKYDSVAHSPEKGNKYKGAKTVIPRQEKTPPPPVPVASKQNVPAKKPTPSKSTVAALTRPEIDITRNENTVSNIDLFARDAIKQALQPETVERPSAPGDKTEERSKQPSAREVEKPDIASPEQSQVIGIPGAKGADVDKYALSDTKDVIDLGDEAVVSLNAKEFRYADYFLSIKKAIEMVWTYPEEAVARGVSGKVMLRFTLNQKGQLEDVRLLKTSSHKILDDEAMLAVKVAAPYDAFPLELDKKRLHIVATFIYMPTYNAVR